MAVNKKLHTWKETMTKGNLGEVTLDRYFHEKGYRLLKAGDATQRRGIDRKFIKGHIELTVEYKTDFKAGETGNAFIETESVRNANTEKKGWLLTTQAQVIVYYLPTRGKALWLSALDLKSKYEYWHGCFRKSTARNDGYHSTGIIVPLEEVEKLARVVFDDLPVTKADK